MNCVISLIVGEKYEKLYGNCVQTHEEYAKKWNYGYKVIKEHVVKDAHLTFTKFNGVLDCFKEGYEWVLFIDSDAIVNNMDIQISYYTDACPVEKDIIMMREIPLGQHCGLFGVINTGVFMIRNTEWSKHFLTELIKIGKSIPDKSIHEQDVMNSVLYQNPHLLQKYWVHEWDRKHSINGFLSFNALTAHKDDFIIHLITCFDMPELVYQNTHLEEREPTLVFKNDEYPKHFETVKKMYPCLMNWPYHGFR